MKITVKKADVSIIVDETDNNIKDRKASIRWEDQMGYVHRTIIVMVEQCIKMIGEE